MRKVTQAEDDRDDRDCGELAFDGFKEFWEQDMQASQYGNAPELFAKTGEDETDEGDI